MAGAVALFFRFMLHSMEENRWNKTMDLIPSVDTVVVETQDDTKEWKEKDAQQLCTDLLPQTQVEGKEFRGFISRGEMEKVSKIQYLQLGKRVLVEEIYRILPEKPEKAPKSMEEWLEKSQFLYVGVAENHYFLLDDGIDSWLTGNP